MNNQDITKKKIDLMKSIHGNPKLSKTFRDAMSAPIGSTKREHAKVILSIMKKVGGVGNDGTGGPMPMGMPTPPAPAPTPSAPNYANMMIFPAAPKFKTRVPEVSTPKKVISPNSFDSNDGSGGPYDGKGGVLDNYSLATNPFALSTANAFQNIGNFLKLPSSTPTSNSGLTGNMSAAPKSTSSFNFSPAPSLVGNPYGLSLPSSLAQSVNSGLNKNGSPLMSMAPTSSSSGYVPNSQSPETALRPGQFGGPVVPPASTTPASTASNALANNPTKTGTTGGSSVSGPTTTGGTPTSTTKTGAPTGTSSGSDLKSAAQSAVNQGTGPGMFAMGVANEKFGGGLDQYIANLDEKLKKDFDLAPLETQLSNLKAQKGNLVPTLTQYIQGKDQYLKFIDKMIDSSEDDLLDVDMSDPASVDRYNNYMNYLYTLKGRQTQRYGNFLNSAISDYNADLEKTQSNYDTVYQHYSDAITRQGTIAQNEYNTLYTAMSDLYNNLEQAPIKRANLEALQLQNEANRITILKAGLGNGQTVNPDYWKDVQTYTDMITSKEDGKKGTLDLTTLTDQGLAGYYNQNLLQGGDEAAMTESIRRALSKTLEISSDPATIAKVKGLIKELAANPDPAGQIFASSINNSIAPTTSKLLSTYILGNIGAVKNAAKSLVKGSSGFLWTGLGADKAGIQDKTTWMKNNGSLDKDFLENLYNAININVGQGTAYEKNPSEIIDRIFSGADQDNANNLANIIAVSS